MVLGFGGPEQAAWQDQVAIEGLVEGLDGVLSAVQWLRSGSEAVSQRPG
jgi:hypothetical protein